MICCPRDAKAVAMMSMIECIPRPAGQAMRMAKCVLEDMKKIENYAESIEKKTKKAKEVL
jgi:hypothetical protein